MRQRYCTGCFADDFWTTLGMPNTPHFNIKTLWVIPFLTEVQEQAESLVHKSSQSFTTIALVHIAEFLAGISWTTSWASQHVVNEVLQTLHKVLIFNNNLSNPFQKWTKGWWYSHWTSSTKGIYAQCTLAWRSKNPKSKYAKAKNSGGGKSQLRYMHYSPATKRMKSKRHRRVDTIGRR